MKKSMKKLLALISVVALLAMMLAGCGSSAKNNGPFTATYDITKDYMTEDEETGALTVSSFPSTPLGENGIAVGYAGSFGAFVDTVTVDTKLEIADGSYTYTLKVHCGSDQCALGNYSPEFTWTGAVEEAGSDSVKIAAPTKASVTIYAEGQFATNEEQTGFFGVVGYTATESTTDCPYYAVPSGSALLEMFSAGSFAVSGSSLGEFTAA